MPLGERVQFRTISCTRVQESLISEIVGLNLNNNYVEINSLKADVTFSFDFAQMVHYPNISDQVGCLYFKVPRKCSLFGVGNKGLGTQVMYLINEIVECEKGSNAVISYIHDYLNRHSFGVSNLSLQADNCSGQKIRLSAITFAPTAILIVCFCKNKTCKIIYIKIKWFIK